MDSWPEVNGTSDLDSFIDDILLKNIDTKTKKLKSTNKANRELVNR